MKLFRFIFQFLKRQTGKLKHKELSNMIKVLFVCLGNICRSPLAEAIFNQKIKELGMEQKFHSDSAGTSDYHIGELPDERTLSCARKYNLSINHRGRQVNRTDFRDFDYIVAMDKNNIQDLNQMKEFFRFHEKDIYLLRDFAKVSKGMSVPDPYYGGAERFEEIYEILVEAIDGFIDFIKITHQVYD